MDGQRFFDPIIRGVAGRNPWVLECFYPLLGLLRPDDRVVDLGGHIGTFALAAAARGCRVLCVEAAPENVALLEASAARNGFDRLHVVQAAASDRPGRLEFLPRGPWGTISNPAARSAPGLISACEHAPVTVPAVTVDGLLAELGWGRVDVLKMDIEGSELRALRGISRLLADSEGLIVFYESNAHTLDFFGATPAALLAAFDEHGYSSYRVEGDRLVPVQPGDFQAKCVVDYLATRGRHPRLGDWEIGPPPSREETVARVVEQCGERIWYHRAYLARTLREAPAAIATDPLVIAAAGALRHDPDARVRLAANRLFDQGG